MSKDLTPTEQAIENVTSSGPTPFERVENHLLDAGGRMIGTAGRLGPQRQTGLSVGYYVGPNGRPLILQSVRGGGVEVFTQLTNDPRIAETLHLLDEYMRDAPKLDTLCGNCGHPTAHYAGCENAPQPEA